jgi:hypothetical protein
MVMNKAELWGDSGLQRPQASRVMRQSCSGASGRSYSTPPRRGRLWLLLGAAFAVWLHSPAQAPAIHVTFTAVITTQAAEALGCVPAAAHAPAESW